MGRPEESNTEDNRQDAEPQRQQNNTTENGQNTTETENKDKRKPDTSELMN